MALIERLFDDIGVDLGTANTLVYVKRRGIAVEEPSVAAFNMKTNRILAVGRDAKMMLERAPGHIRVVRPLVEGVISDFDVAYELLRQFLKHIAPRPLLGFRRGVLGIPIGLTEVERKSVEDAARQAGCAKVYLVESPVAAALGAGLPIESPTASLIVDVGGGTSDIAVISMGGVVRSQTLKIAGDKFDEDIIRFVRDEFKLAIGVPTAEFVKTTIGSAVPLEERIEVPVRGRDLSSGLPREVIMKNVHARAALSKSLKVLTDSIQEVIETTPPELVGDMLKQGIWVSGGGALLAGIDRLIQEKTGVETKIVDDPLTVMVRGLGSVVDDPERYRGLLDNPLKPMDIKL